MAWFRCAWRNDLYSKVCACLLNDVVRPSVVAIDHSSKIQPTTLKAGPAELGANADESVRSGLRGKQPRPPTGLACSNAIEIGERIRQFAGVGAVATWPGIDLAQD